MMLTSLVQPPTNVSVTFIDCQHWLAKVHGAAEALRGQTLHYHLLCEQNVQPHFKWGCLGKAMSKIWVDK